MSEPTLEPKPHLEDVLLNGLHIEQRVAKLGDHEAVSKWDTKKVKLSYDKSLARLQEAGYERHLRPSEYVSIYLDYLEKIVSTENIESIRTDWGTRSPQDRRTFLEGIHPPAVIDFHEDLTMEGSEHLSAAIETTLHNKDTVVLTLYIDPQGLSCPSVWDKYEKTRDFTCAYTKEFIFERRILTSYLPRPEIVINPTFTLPIPLEVFPDAMITELYGRTLADLTQFERKYNTPLDLGLYLPAEGIIHPLASGNSSKLNFECFNDAASRGASRVVRSETGTAV